KLVGTTSNRDAIGARVEVKAGALDQMAEVRSGCCYLSQSDMRLHFGLGNIQEVEAIKVRWPSGQTETFAVKGINRIIELREGTGS
ncbi:MAG: ASPIC/UnbV domain-containing protein, partial [Acidobacteriaceae bacterium]